MIIEREIPQLILDAATERANELGKLNNSIEGGEGNLAGFVGEYMLMEYLDINPDEAHHQTYDYDVMYKGVTVDVKTKRTKVKPRDYYECSIAAYNTTQNCQAYVFIRVRNDFKVGWILGYLPKKVYFDKSKFMVKGEVDPANNFTVKADCYNLPISALSCVSDFIKE